MLAQRGDLTKAAELAEHALRLADRHGWTRRSRAFGAQFALAVVHYERNDLETSSRYLTEAAQSEAVESDPTAAYQVVFGRVRRHVSEGNPESALGEIDVFEHRLDTARAAPLLRSRLAALRASALLAAGLWDEVIATLPLTEGVDQPAFARILVARAYAAMLDHRAARRTLAPLLEAPAMPVRVELDVLLTESVAATALGQSADASVALVSALNRATPERFVRAFLDAGPALGPMLEKARPMSEAHRAMIDELVAIESGMAGVRRRRQVLADPLTKRELAALQFLPTVLSVTEIADSLQVSPNTVKTFIKSIYRKLDVENRRTAVRRAYDLHLL